MEASRRFSNTLRVLFASAILWTVSLKADTITLKDGTVLEGVKITKVEPHQITVMNDTGIQKVPLSNLSPELQKKYSYDPLVAQEYITAQAAAALQKQQAQAAMVSTLQSQAQMDALLSHAAIDAGGKTIQVVDGGILTNVWTEKAYTQTRVVDPNPTGGGPVFKKEVYTTTEEGVRREQIAELAYVECNTSEMVDGESWHSVIYPCGTFAYQNVSGARRTVKKFTTNPAKAMKYLESKL